MPSLGRGLIQLRALTLLADGRQHTAREIADALGHKRQQVYQALNALKRHGFVTHQSTGARKPGIYEINAKGRDLIYPGHHRPIANVHLPEEDTHG